MSDFNPFRASSKKQLQFLKSEAQITVYGGAVGCVDKDTEFLTPQGWKRISEYNDDEVMVVSLDGLISRFEKPEFIKKESTGFYRINNKLFSEEHNIVYKNKNKFSIISFKEFLESGKKLSIPLGNTGVGLGESLDYIRLQALLLTRANSYGGIYSLRTKESKIQNTLTWLAEKLGVTLEKRKSYNNNYELISIFYNNPLLTEEDLWSLNAQEAKAFLAFADTSKLSLDLSQYLINLANDLSFEVFDPTKAKLEENNHEYKYCFTTSTGAWLARKNGVIFTTGNSGKSYQGLLRHLLYVHDPKYVGYVIRKTETVMRTGGGLFDKAVELYTEFVKPAKLKVTYRPMRITFPSGAVIQFTGFEDDRAISYYTGLNISAAMLDEGNQLSKKHVDLLLMRLRTEANMKPNMWITCNPDPDSYLMDWVRWYLYPEGHEFAGRPDPLKNGKTRWMLEIDGSTEWGDSPEELRARFGEHLTPMSFKFIGATIHDNPYYVKANPHYIPFLENRPRVEKERNLYGNWFAREEGSGYFKREWMSDPLILPPDNIVSRVRCWDLAATLPSEANPDPDYTVGVLMAKTQDGLFVIEDVIQDRWRWGELNNVIADTMRLDKAFYGDVPTFIPQDAGASGIIAANSIKDALKKQNLEVGLIKVSNNSKLNRFKPFAAAAELRKTRIVKKDWNLAFFLELEAFDGTRKSVHDDIVDATADCFNKLATKRELPEFELPDL